MNSISVIGLDLGDKRHAYCALDAEGSIVKEGSVSATRTAVLRFLKKFEPCTVALEAGTHSPWVSRLVTDLGHSVVVGNPRKLRMIFTQDFKSDRNDAEILARVARLDPQLLRPIRHRSAESQADLALIRSREALVRCRTQLINRVRGVVKSFGERLPSCSAEAFARRAGEALPPQLRPALSPLLVTITRLCAQLRQLDRQIEQVCTERYPHTHRLRSIRGVGPLTALSFVLVVDDPHRFASGRSLGAYLGLVPRRDQSGEVDKQLPITRAGDRYLRQLLVSCAHYIMGPFGQDSALRRWGESLAERGGRSARKKAVVALARKLCVVMWSMWINETSYEPFPARGAIAA